MPGVDAFLGAPLSTPIAPPTATRVTISGPCRLIAGGSCAISPNYPDFYGALQSCELTGVPQVPLVVHRFEVEKGYDNMYVNGVAYTGSGVQSGPHGVVPSDGRIRWESDSSIGRGGWAVCWDSFPPMPPSPPPTPPSPSPAPLYPPLPDALRAAARMCFVLKTPLSEFDELGFRTGIAQAFGLFRPYVYGLTLGSCTLNQSSLCTNRNAQFYAPEGTSINENRTMIEAASPGVTVVSVWLVQDTHSGGPHKRSPIGRICDRLIDLTCSTFFTPDEADYGACASSPILREGLCFACPTDQYVGLFGRSVTYLEGATGYNMSFVTFQEAEGKAPWTAGDIVWLTIWMAPVWLLFFSPLIIFLRRMLRPAGTVRRELEEALDRVETEDIRTRFGEAEVVKALREVRWLAGSLVALAMLLFPWLPFWFILVSAMPLARSTVAADWVSTAQAWRRGWLNWSIASCLIHAAWLIISWGLTRRHTVLGDEGATAASAGKSQSELLDWQCDQLFGTSVNAIGAEVAGGRVCELFSALFPASRLVLPWVLFGQGCICIAAAPLALALLLRTVGQGRRELREDHGSELAPEEVGYFTLRLSMYLALPALIVSPPAGLLGFQACRLWFEPVEAHEGDGIMCACCRQPRHPVRRLGTLATMYNFALASAGFSIASVAGYLGLATLGGPVLVCLIAVILLAIQAIVSLVYACRLRWAVGRLTKLGLTCSGWWFMVPSCLPRYCRLLWPPSIDSLIAGALSAKASSDARFAGKSSDLISGQPKEAATGIYGFIGYGEVELRQRCLEGTAAIVKEVEAFGDPSVIENLNYILYAEAGSSEDTFHNGWCRDRAPDGSHLEGRHGMRLKDFASLPIARRGMLEEAHVVALRLYSTSAFTVLNGPMRNLKTRLDARGVRVPREPPQLAAPHPLPVTMAFIYEGLKRLRAVNAHLQVAKRPGMLEGASSFGSPNGSLSNIARVEEDLDEATARTLVASLGRNVSVEIDQALVDADARPSGTSGPLPAPCREAHPPGSVAVPVVEGLYTRVSALDEPTPPCSHENIGIHSSANVADTEDSDESVGGPTKRAAHNKEGHTPGRRSWCKTWAPWTSSGGQRQHSTAASAFSVEMAASESATEGLNKAPPTIVRGSGTSHHKASLVGHSSEAIANALRETARLPGVASVVRGINGSQAADGTREETILWRGMGNMHVTNRFMMLGGTELACCSATSQLDIAARYARKGGNALLFRIRSTTFMNLGCDISDLSAFPHEKEFLYPPLTFLHPNGVVHKLKRAGVQYTVVEVEPSFPS